MTRPTHLQRVDSGALFERGDATVRGSFFSKNNAGFVLERGDLTALIGAPDGGSVYVKQGGRKTTLELTHPLLGSPRELFFGQDGIVHWNGFFLKENAPKGLGTRMAAYSLYAAQAAGFTEVQAMAWGPPNFNGHYTWARLGFDAVFNDDEIRWLSQKGAEEGTVQQLMASSVGRMLWRAKGWSMEMAFDLSPNGLSMKVLDSYLHEKGIGL